LILAYSHGVLMGPQVGMSSLAEMRQVAMSLGKADGLMVTPGMVSKLEEAFIGRDRPALVVQLDYQSFSRRVLSYAEGATVEMGEIEDALAAGADAVMTYLYMGYEDPEREKWRRRNARLGAASAGVGLMIEPPAPRERTHRR
jgi:class I fructose-bisphosphate aldolase